MNARALETCICFERKRKKNSSLVLSELLGGDILKIQEELRNVLFTIARNNAIFKTKVQRGGRISIPEAERDVLGISEGDIVQVILAPIKKSTST